MELRSTFDRRADRYHRARPRYPAELFDALESIGGINAPAAVLEIGPATGVATEELARRGLRVDAVELGPHLAAAAAVNLAAHPEVRIIQADFETWQPDRWGSYDAVVAATMWHWLDPAIRYRRAWRHLRPGGILGFWSASHVVPVGGDPFFADLQAVYDEIGESHPDADRFPAPGELPDLSDEIVADGGFEVLGVRHFDWEIRYDATGYIDLLETFSGHIEMGPAKRDHLFGEIRQRLTERPSGLVRRHWGAVLHLARRVDGAGDESAPAD